MVPLTEQRVRIDGCAIAQLLQIIAEPNVRQITLADAIDRRIGLQAGGVGAAIEVPQPDRVVIGTRGEPPVQPEMLFRETVRQLGRSLAAPNRRSAS
jgi:hypothetical protein